MIVYLYFNYTCWPVERYESCIQLISTYCMRNHKQLAITFIFTNVPFFALADPCSLQVDIIHIHLASWVELSHSSRALIGIEIYVACEAPWIYIYHFEKKYISFTTESKD